MSAYCGFLIVDKPPGVRSFSMVSLVRRLSGVRRVGHAGTLDPLASGVLPVAVGPATRLIEYLDDEPKTYAARIQLGVSTDTYDAGGEVTARREASCVSARDVERTLAGFVGDIEQVPPAYSAIKVAGKPLYRYAREGASVAPAPRIVRIEKIEMRSFAAGVAEVEVRCGKGTYIRSLAHDLGERLGCGAHLAALVRTRSGGFRIEEAHAPEAITSAASEGHLEDLLLAPDRAVERRPAAILGEQRTRDVLAGRDLDLAADSRTGLCRAYSVAGDFLGVLGRRSDGFWHPEKVIAGP